MIDNEDILTRLKQKGNPFIVPDNYFEDFTNRIMAELPEENKAKVMSLKDVRHRLMLRIITAAACIALVVGGSGLFFHKSSSASNIGASAHQVQTIKSSTKDTYIDQATDYAMMDNQDIYACLSSDE